MGVRNQCYVGSIWKGIEGRTGEGSGVFEIIARAGVNKGVGQISMHHSMALRPTNSR